MNKKTPDMGDMTSREIGNLVSKGLVNLGKEALASNSPTGEVDYGNLPSRALPELGKQVLANKLDERN